MAPLRNAGDWGGLACRVCGLDRLAGHQIMEDLIGYMRELKLYPEPNGDHRKACTRGVTWSEMQFGHSSTSYPMMLGSRTHKFARCH